MISRMNLKTAGAGLVALAVTLPTLAMSEPRNVAMPSTNAWHEPLKGGANPNAPAQPGIANRTDAIRMGAAWSGWDLNRKPKPPRGYEHPGDPMSVTTDKTASRVLGDRGKRSNSNFVYSAKTVGNPQQAQMGRDANVIYNPADHVTKSGWNGETLQVNGGWVKRVPEFQSTAKQDSTRAMDRVLNNGW